MKYQQSTRRLSHFLFAAVAAACSAPEGQPLSQEQVQEAITIPTYQRVIVDSSAPGNPWMKSIGDLNGDGNPDLVVSGENGPIVWYQNPTWVKRTIVSSPSVGSQSGSAVADIDRDGDQDVIVGPIWYENVNSGSSWTAHPLPDPNAGTHDIVVADVNADGKPDIVMRGENSSPVFCFLQDTPTSWTEFTADPGIGRNGLDVADLNGDGRPDFVVGGRWLQNPGGNVARGQWALHTFANWNDYASVTVTDLNGDGSLDIVLSVSESTGDLAWFQGPNFAQHTIATGLTLVHAFVVADTNGDGLRDVIASEYGGDGRLIIYLNQGSALSWTSTVVANDAIHNLRGADLNRDGIVDFFGANAWGYAPVITYLSQKGGGGSGSGGAPGAGGATSSGGAVSSGGATSSGGAVSSGGATSSGGASSGGSEPIDIGEKTVLSGSDSGNGGLVVAQSAMLSKSATIQTLSFYVLNAAGKLRLGIYDSTSGGDPFSLKAATAEFTPRRGWNTVAVATPVSLPAGKYWLTYAPSSSSLSFPVVQGGAVSRYFARSYQSLPPTFATNPSSFAGHWSFYATLQP